MVIIMVKLKERHAEKKFTKKNTKHLIHGEKLVSVFILII